jgi:Arc/MetJ-type ribon-helix-helix transcriptional regulator
MYEGVLIFMTAETRIMISGKIPINLHEAMIKAVENKEYRDKTEVLNVALERLLLNNLNKLNTQQENEDTNSVINSNIMNATDKIEYTKLQTRLEEKEKWIIELQHHNETLKKELEKAGQDKEAAQNLYNNYMLQMQTLINQKVIEAPGAKKPWWRFW